MLTSGRVMECPGRRQRDRLASLPRRENFLLEMEERMSRLSQSSILLLRLSFKLSCHSTHNDEHHCLHWKPGLLSLTWRSYEHSECNHISVEDFHNRPKNYTSSLQLRISSDRHKRKIILHFKEKIVFNSLFPSVLQIQYKFYWDRDFMQHNRSTVK